MRDVMRAAFAGLVVALVLAASAEAHGPCGSCLSRTSGPPKTRVTVRTTAYWIIWNGTGLPQDGALGPVHRRDERTIELVRCRQAPPDSVPVLLCPARRDVSFVVPDVPPGPYPVVIYDGSEGGFHYTWDLFRVTAVDETDHHLYVALLAGGFLLLIAVTHGARRVLVQRSPQGS
jgi:hypothetical protein